MKRVLKSGLVAAMLVLAGCASRPKAPPPDLAVLPEWGSVLSESIRGNSGPAFDRDSNDPYAVLALSAPGSRGAFGAGLLAGWSASGERPEFEVVTAAGAAATMATFAFLGPAYDEQLKGLFIGVETRDVYRRFGLITLLGDGAMNSPKPLRRRLEELIDDAVLDAVAAEHAAGRRLYVATTNIDQDRFVIWDMGAIASSERANRLERYLEVVLASTTVGGFFPPVYIEVETDGGAEDEEYRYAHVGGDLKEPAFVRPYMLPSGRRTDVYVLLCEQLSGPPDYGTPVEPGVLTFADVNRAVLYGGALEAAVCRMYELVRRRGNELRTAVIPADFGEVPRARVFDPVVEQRLFDFGYENAATAWRRLPDDLDCYQLRDYMVD